MIRKKDLLEEMKYIKNAILALEERMNGLTNYFNITNTNCNKTQEQVSSLAAGHQEVLDALRAQAKLNEVIVELSKKVYGVKDDDINQ